jgi:hypothetical protein
MNQFLILHKVRGEPAFDIAEPVKIGDEEGWVLCTCGHRAYPYLTWRLDQLYTNGDRPVDFGDHDTVPSDWPDHYSPKPEAKLKLNVLEVVSRMLPKLKRRI